MKIVQLQRLLKEKNIDCALFIVEEHREPNIIYFTQLSNITHAALLIPSSGKPTLYLSPLDYIDARKESAIKNTVLLKESLFKLLKKNHGPKSIGIDASNLSYRLSQRIKETLPSVKISSISDEMKTLRLVKTDEELNNMRAAASIANKAFTAINENFTFKTETEVKAALEYEMAKRGASPSFPTIVASGRNASTPHHVTSSEKLQKGFCVIDFGAAYRGYCSDCTRMLYKGNPSKQEKQLYTLLCNSQQKAIDAVRLNVSCAELDKTARKALGKYQKFFTHSLGHGIGIEVHESPSLSSQSTDKLTKNTPFTIEPGIYIPNKLGMRIEDLFVITNKPTILTSIPKELIKIPQ